jgi:predicted permease
VGRRDRLLREIHARLQSTPGIEAVTFSQLGLFSGGVSTAGIVVEGSALTVERPRESALDRVGSGYFATLGIPLRTGRDISASDGADSHKVAIVNEAFVRRFFEGRNPIGLRVTTDGEQDAGTAYEVIGVAGNARTQTLRGDVEPRFFVPAEQRGSGAGSRVFLIRTQGSVASVAAAVRQVASAVDPFLTVSEIAPLENRLAELTAEDGAVARLAIAFGIVALTLAAAGLYGVLSYGVSRRSSEIAVRIALGAQAQRVVGMIMRESMGVVLAGLTAGAALAYLATRLIAGRLYEVAPQDPATLAAAVAGLLIVAAAAAYLPARRASRVNPVAALHQL